MPSLVPGLVIEMKDVAAAYGEERVLERVNFTIPPRRYVGIIGPNGGGKTTLLKLILGLLKPLEGEIRVFGQAPGTTPQRIGYVPQISHFDKSFPVTVADVVLMGRLGQGSWRTSFSEHDRLLAKRALERVWLDSKMNAHMGELSGGEKQRVFLARALACEPDLLILDEPTASIDSRIEQHFYALLHELSHEKTIILVSHDVGVIASEVNDIICVNRGITLHDAKTITRDSVTTLYDKAVVCVDHHCHL